MSIEIESSDVIKLIQQFLKENKLAKTLMAIQEETGLTLNSIPDIDGFLDHVRGGHWDSVIQAIQHFKISNNTLMNLYEQIIIEMAEMRELAMARLILRQTDAMDIMQKTLPDRYMKLENLLSKTYFDHQDAYSEGSNREKRRRIIASDLKKEVVNIAPSRLLTLLGQALKWQNDQGLIPSEAKVDLLSGKVSMKELTEETFPTTLSLSIKVIAFSPDGQYLVSGSTDGFIEVWNYMTGKLRVDLNYQATQNFMIMENTVTSLTFSKDSNIFASGDSKGMVKIWRIQTGQCIKRLDKTHDGTVRCILFSSDQTQLFTGSVDALIRLHSLKSGIILKEFSGHTSFINSINYGHDSHHLISTSSDSSIRIWSIKNAECLKELRITVGPTKFQLAINLCLPHPSIPDSYIVSNRSTDIYVLNKEGKIIKYYNNGRKNDDGNFVSAFLSPKGNWVYAVTNDGFIYCLSLADGKFQHHMKVQEKDVGSNVHHPNLNLVATCGTDGFIKIWR